MANALTEGTVTEPFRLAQYVEVVDPMDLEGVGEELSNILQSHYQNTFGGAENWKRLESFKLEGKLQMEQGETFDFVALKKKPDFVKVELTAPTEKKFIMGYDGRDAWQLVTAAESELGAMPEKEALNFIRDAITANHLLYPKLPGKRIELAGSVRLGDDLCYLLNVRLPNGQALEYALDMDDLVERRRRYVNAVTGETETLRMFEHKRVEGVAVARRTELYIEGSLAHTISLEAVRTNTGVTTWMFSRESANYLIQPAAAEAEVPTEGLDAPFGTRFSSESPFDAALEDFEKDAAPAK